MNLLGISDYFLQLADQASGMGENEMLQQLCTRFGFSHASYVLLGMADIEDGAPQAFTTYDPEWIKLYIERDYQFVDPVMTIGFQSFLPLDWRSVRKLSPEISDFFNIAGEFGVANNGISIPIRGVHGERALLSINIDATAKEWSALSRSIMSNCTYFAMLFHQNFLDKHLPADDGKLIELSPRELEVLKWAAEGKSAWETCKVLDLSEETVRFYLKNSYAKLNVANKAQAVAKTYRMGLLL